VKARAGENADRQVNPLALRTAPGGKSATGIQTVDVQNPPSSLFDNRSGCIL
jgi:hypothetical protein